MNIKDKIYRCTDCGTKISRFSAIYGKGRCKSCAKKGSKGYWLGKHLSKETRLKLSKTHKGKKLSKETRLKLSKSKIGNKFRLGHKTSKETKEKLSKSLKGCKRSKETRLKNSLAQKGKKNSNYLNGLSLCTYPSEWTEELKQKIRCRDGHKCQICNKTEAQEVKEFKRLLCVHHINYDKQNCKEKNLISLCNKCHIKTNYNRKKWIKYFFGEGLI